MKLCWDNLEKLIYNLETGYYNPERNQQKKQEYREGWVAVLALHRKLECATCGEDTFVCLDFHHRNPKQKEFSPSRYFTCKPTQKLVSKVLAEFDKCDVVCANCHRKIHAGY